MQLYREGEEPAGRIGGKETRTARLLAQAAGLHAAMGSPALPAAQFAAKPRPLVDETCVRVVPPPEEDANVEELAVAEAPPPVPPPLPPSLTQVQATLREPAAARGWAGQACAPAASLSSCFDQQSSRHIAATHRPRPCSGNPSSCACTSPGSACAAPHTTPSPCRRRRRRRRRSALPPPAERRPPGAAGPSELLLRVAWSPVKAGGSGFEGWSGCSDVRGWWECEI